VRARAAGAAGAVSLAEGSSTLAAFRVKSFRYQWPADLLTSWAFEMETLILGWYVMVHTGSVLLLTTFGSLQFLGTLAAPMFGVLGDRLGGRTMLCVMRASYGLLAALLAVLALAGLLTPASVLVVAALSGIVRPNDLVMRNSLIGDTIPPDHLMGALGMSRATMDSARIAGALAGAGLSAALGIGTAYVFVTSFYAASLALTFGVARGRPVADPSGGRSRPARGALGMSRPSSWRELLDGLVHVWTTPKLLSAIWLAFLVNLTAYPISSGLLPYVARTIYRIDAGGLGWLVAGFALGALVGSIAMVVTGGPRHPERSTVINIAIWYALLLAFGHVRTLAAGILVLVVAGLAQSIAMISMSATLLGAAGHGFRGRVMGVRTLAVYGLPLGLMTTGALVDWLGFPATVTICGAIGLSSTLLIGARWRASMWHA
jgi:MFS family permease